MRRAFPAIASRWSCPRRSTRPPCSAKACAKASRVCRPRGVDARFRLSISLGVTPFNGRDGELGRSLAEAESACKAAKDRGRNRLETFQENDVSIIRRFTDINVATDVRAALAENRLRLEAQMIVPFADDGPDARPHYEMLLRMLDPEGNTIGPDRFLSAALRYQMMPTIDRWVISTVIELLRPHRELLASAPVCFTINFSGQSLHDEEFADYVIRSIENSRINPAVFCFELTESAAVASINDAEALMQRLRKLGCGVALDDFGTGLSSLSYLRSMPVSMLKIDGSFVRDILRDERAESMVRAIAQLARAMNITTVAEYVETEEIRTRVRMLWASTTARDSPSPGRCPWARCWSAAGARRRHARRLPARRTRAARGLS